MTRTSPATIRRAAASFLAAVAFSFTVNHASAQMIDLFAGGYGANPASLSVANTTLSVNNSATGTFGPNFTGTVNAGVTALGGLTEGFSANGSSNQFTIASTGVAGLLQSTTASKTYTGISLSPNTTYSFTLNRSSNSTVTLLGSLAIQLTAGGTTFVDTTTNQGLLGAVNLLNLFSTANTASFQFTTPSNISGNLGMNINTTIAGSVAGTSFTFTSAAINQVPEPTTVAASLIGMSGLVVLRMRRRLRSI